jgi:uncharacterized protein
MTVVDSLAVGSGALVGFILGLIGGGGSILATPLLLYVVGVRDPHVAIGTSALAVSASAFVNLIGHARAGTVIWRDAAMFAVAGVAGALLGSTAGKAFNGERLLFLFGLLMLVVGALMLRPRQPAPLLPPSRLAATLWTVAVGFGVGLASGFFGIGGGFLIVPGLIVATGMPMLNAIGSSLLSVGSFGLTTAVNYAWSGLVDWLVTAEFIAGGVLGGMVGLRLAVRLSAYKGVLNKIFSAVIFVVAAYVLYRNRTAYLP